ncbi:hypothetical protein MTP99_008013 [Tenebrio molitor]|uniref:Cilia-and flagella-associated protein 96 n=1 Tax=Tenebrio molitor TaxID=7067 RepID=A0A8J6HG96_TENMO|nr:hypothetical protein GEV33_008954 [Tenebrio molitor]KAJ3635080.1 hypothetical protein MTP99_008013 [Tenebrio molitor]
MAKKRSNSPDLGHKFGRPDIERIGLFSEMAYLSAKSLPKKKTQREGRNMYCEGRKTKNGTQHGYFEPVFKRIFSKEAIRGRGKKPVPSKYKNVSERPFMPPIGFKHHACPGDYYGTFSGIIEAFSNKRKPNPPHKAEGRNLLGAPGKLGGPGYADIALSPYPEHKPDRYGLKPKYKEYGKNLGGPMLTVHYPQFCFDKNPYGEPEGMKPGPTYIRPKEKEENILPPGYIVPTGPGKWQGGCHDGCFDKFPEYKFDRYGVRIKKPHEDAFYPPSTALKSYYNTSVLFQGVDVKINKKNYSTIQPTYIKYIIND